MTSVPDMLISMFDKDVEYVIDTVCDHGSSVLNNDLLELLYLYISEVEDYETIYELLRIISKYIPINYLRELCINSTNHWLYLNLVLSFNTIDADFINKINDVLKTYNGIIQTDITRFITKNFKDIYQNLSKYIKINVNKIVLNKDVNYRDTILSNVEADVFEHYYADGYDVCLNVCVCAYKGSDVAKLIRTLICLMFDCKHIEQELIDTNQYGYEEYVKQLLSSIQLTDMFKHPNVSIYLLFDGVREDYNELFNRVYEYSNIAVWLFSIISIIYSPHIKIGPNLMKSYALQYFTAIDDGLDYQFVWIIDDDDIPTCLQKIYENISSLDIYEDCQCIALNEYKSDAVSKSYGFHGNIYRPIKSGRFVRSICMNKEDLSYKCCINPAKTINMHDDNVEYEYIYFTPYSDKNYKNPDALMTSLITTEYLNYEKCLISYMSDDGVYVSAPITNTSFGGGVANKYHNVITCEHDYVTVVHIGKKCKEISSIPKNVMAMSHSNIIRTDVMEGTIPDKILKRTMHYTGYSHVLDNDVIYVDKTRKQKLLDNSELSAEDRKLVKNIKANTKTMVCFIEHNDDNFDELITNAIKCLDMDDTRRKEALDYHKNYVKTDVYNGLDHIIEIMKIINGGIRLSDNTCLINQFKYQYSDMISIYRNTA